MKLTWLFLFVSFFMTANALSQDDFYCFEKGGERPVFYQTARLCSKNREADAEGICHQSVSCVWLTPEQKKQFLKTENGDQLKLRAFLEETLNLSTQAADTSINMQARIEQMLKSHPDVQSNAVIKEMQAMPKAETSPLGAPDFMWANQAWNHLYQSLQKLNKQRSDKRFQLISDSERFDSFVICRGAKVRVNGKDMVTCRSADACKEESFLVGQTPVLELDYKPSDLVFTDGKLNSNPSNAGSAK